jgi:hypothetical protein
MDAVDIIIRPFEKAKDQAFIYSSWRNSAHWDAIVPIDYPSNKFYRAKTKEINEILKTAQVRIASFKDDPNMIAGYAVSEFADLPPSTNLIFIYVKIELRARGIGTLLFPKSTLTVGPELTNLGKLIAEKKKLIIKEKSNGNTNSKVNEETRDYAPSRTIRYIP